MTNISSQKVRFGIGFVQGVPPTVEVTIQLFLPFFLLLSLFFSFSFSFLFLFLFSVLFFFVLFCFLCSFHAGTLQRINRILKTLRSGSHSSVSLTLGGSGTFSQTWSTLTPPIPPWPLEPTLTTHTSLILQGLSTSPR